MAKCASSSSFSAPEVGAGAGATASGATVVTSRSAGAEGARRPRKRLSSWRRPVVTTNCPMTRALLTWSPKRCRPFAAISSTCSSSRSVCIASSAGAKTNRSSRRSAVGRASLPPEPFRCSGSASVGRAVPFGSDAVAAEPLAFVGQLADVLHEEAGATHELVGLLGQDALGRLGTILGVGQLVVFRLILDDESFLQDHVETGFDVLVLGLLLF